MTGFNLIRTKGQTLIHVTVLGNLRVVVLGDRSQTKPRVHDTHTVDVKVWRMLFSAVQNGWAVGWGQQVAIINGTRNRDGYVHYLDYGDDVTGACLRQN